MKPFSSPKISKLLKKINIKLVFWVIFCLLFLAWAFTQFYRLSQTFYLYHDFAQYAFKMFDWRSSGEIPLLGPFVTYVNFYLPPTYYWIIYPFYLITNGSIFYNHLACFVYTWVIFLGLALALYKRPTYRWSFLFLIALFCLNPLIIVNRTHQVWNPSYIWQPVVVAWYCLALSTQSKRRLLLCVIGGAACAVVIGMELLIIPVVIGLLIVSALRLRGKVLPWLISFSVASSICWLPVLAVQFNQILNTSLVLPNQPADLFAVRFYKLFATAFAPTIYSYNHINLNPHVIVLYVILLAVVIFYLKKNWGIKMLRQDWFQVLLVLTITAIISLIPKIEMSFWYTTGLAAIIILLLVNLPGRLKYLISTLLTIYWLTFFFKSANIIASAPSIESCLKQICQRVTPYQYYYVSYADDITSGNALAYFLTTAGCPPVQRWRMFDLDQPEDSINTDYQLLAAHYLDTSQHSNPLYIEHESFLNEFYSHPIASASCDGNWGWTLYDKVHQDEIN